MFYGGSFFSLLRGVMQVVSARPPADVHFRVTLKLLINTIVCFIYFLVFVCLDSVVSLAIRLFPYFPFTVLAICVSIPVSVGLSVFLCVPVFFVSPFVSLYFFLCLSSFLSSCLPACLSPLLSFFSLSVCPPVRPPSSATLASLMQCQELIRSASHLKEKTRQVISDATGKYSR